MAVCVEVYYRKRWYRPTLCTRCGGVGDWQTIPYQALDEAGLVACLCEADRLVALCESMRDQAAALAAREPRVDLDELETSTGR